MIRLLPASCSFCFAAMAPLAAAEYAINCYTSLLAASACLSLVACASKRSLVWLRSAQVWRASVPRRLRRRRSSFSRKRRLIHVALLWLCLTQPCLGWATPSLLRALLLYERATARWQTWRSHRGGSELVDFAPGGAHTDNLMYCRESIPLNVNKSCPLGARADDSY